jgi:hypothetical protein
MCNFVYEGCMLKILKCDWLPHFQFLLGWIHQRLWECVIYIYIYIYIYILIYYFVKGLVWKIQYIQDLCVIVGYKPWNSFSETVEINWICEGANTAF